MRAEGEVTQEPQNTISQVLERRPLGCFVSLARTSGASPRSSPCLVRREALGVNFLDVVPPERAVAHGYLNRCFAVEMPSGLSVADLTGGGGLEGLFTRYAASLPGADRRALGSMWWQHYISYLLPPALALRLRGVSLSADAARTGVCIGDRGLIEGFAIDVSHDASGRDGTVDDAAWLASVIAGLCHPVAAELHRLTRVSYRTLWANAAARLDGLGSLFDPSTGARIVHLLDARDHDGVPNPMFRLLRDGDPTVCCLRDRLPGILACGNCPVTRRAQVDLARHRRSAPAAEHDLRSTMMG